MKNITFISSLFGLLLTLVACKKNHTESGGKDARGLIANAYHKITTTGAGEIALVNDLTQTRLGGVGSQFHFEGTFAGADLFGDVGFNNNYIIPVVNSAFEMSSAVDTPVLRGHEADYFGTSNEIRLGGNILTSDFYAPYPVPITFTGNGSDSYEFPKAGGIQFNFPADPGNSNPIIVVLQYIQPNAPEGSVVLTKDFSFAPGSTSGSISSADLGDFPVNTELVMYAGSGNEVAYTLNGETYVVTALNITYIPGIKLY